MEEKKQSHLALDAIRKKLVGKELSYQEIYAVMDQIADKKLGDVLTTYFVASGYTNGYTDDELYFLTKAMVETGEQLEFSGTVADKHSIGGTPGARTTMIVTPIVAAAGFKIPKSSSRAITTPAGTADSMEVLANVSFTKKEIYKIVEKANGCIVWGGSFKIAPADDEIIRIEEPLMHESYDKVLVSVMAKKIAFGSNHVVIEIPYGKTVKVHREEEAHLWAKKFEGLAKRFNINLKVVIEKVEEPAGGGVGPLLEARDALRVLEQTENRSLDLEERALRLSGTLLDLCISDMPDSKRREIHEKYKNGYMWAKDLLVNGRAHAQMSKIIEAQGGNPAVRSVDLKPAKFAWDYKSPKNGKITAVDNMNVTRLAKVLGAPKDKRSGMDVFVKKRQTVKKGEIIATFYGETKKKLNEAISLLELFPVFTIE